MNLNKTSLINRVAEQAGITKVQAEREIENVLKGIEGCLAEIGHNGQDTGKLQILNYFSIEVKYKKAHEARNPITKEVVDVPGKNKIKFTPGKLLNEAIN